MGATAPAPPILRRPRPYADSGQQAIVTEGKAPEYVAPPTLIPLEQPPAPTPVAPAPTPVDERQQMVEAMRERSLPFLGGWRYRMLGF